MSRHVFNYTKILLQLHQKLDNIQDMTMTSVGYEITELFILLLSLALSLSRSLSLSLSAFTNTEFGLLENCLTFEERNFKMKATCVTPRYHMVYLWKTADEVQAEEKETYVERRISLLRLTKSYEQVLVPQHL
jgi:hypothetical protein